VPSETTGAADDRSIARVGSALLLAANVLFFWPVLFHGRVFSSHLPGQDVAKLVLAGWMPAELAFGIAVGIRHDDWNTRQQRTWTAGNVEVGAYTELIHQTRSDARRAFAAHVRSAGADGAVVASMRLNSWEIEPAEGHTDHVAESTIFGTAIAQFHRSTAAPSRSLTYLPLKRSRS